MGHSGRIGSRPEPSGATDFFYRFGVSMVVAVFALLALAPLRAGLQGFTIWSIQSSAQLVGLQARSGDDALLVFVASRGPAFAYRVIEECTAVSVIALFAMGVFALPGIRWGRRFVGLAAGTAVLLVANWLRLLNLAWLGVHHPAYFDVAHVWVWQAFGMALLLAIWMIWMRWATGQGGRSQLGRQGMLWFGGVTAVGAVLHLTSAGELYSRVVEMSIRGVHAVLEALPYRTLVLAESASSWQVEVRSVSLVVALALTAALTGPAARQRLVATAKAVPLVYIAHVVATLLERAADARFGVERVGIPMLAMVYALPLLVPVLLGYRGLVGAQPTLEELPLPKYHQPGSPRV